MKTKIVWTRSKDCWNLDKQYFKEVKDEVIHAPCIYHESTPLSQADIDIILQPRGEPSVFIWTSVRAVKEISKYDNLLHCISKSTNYCFGESTAKELAKINIHTTTPKKIRSAKSLGIMLKDIITKSSQIFLPGGKNRAYDLMKLFSTHGFKAYNLNLYKTLINNHDQLICLSKELFSGKKIVCFASPSSVEG